MRFRERGCQVRDLTGHDPDEAAALAGQCVADGAGTLVVCGGDGMVHLAAQAVVGTPTALGIIPAGSGNDVARYLDLPRTDAAAAADRVLSGRRRRLDVVQGDTGYYVTVLAAGFDALVNERANRMRRPRGQLRYTLATLAELRRLAPLSYTLDLDGISHEVEAVLVAVGNGPSFGGGLRITEGAELDDGLLDVVVIGPIGRLDLVRTYPRLFTGRHTTHPQYRHHRARRVGVAGPTLTAYADGERFGDLPITLTCLSGELTVIA